MTSEQFFEQLDLRIAKYNLLCHPFYKAWRAGELTREDLSQYGRDYYHHVDAFPAHLAEFAIRLEESELRRAVLVNLCEEKGGEDSSGRAHSELWLDFVEGMGGNRQMYGHQPIAEIRKLIEHFSHVAREGSPEEALGAFYAYESQVPPVAKEKARGLKTMYGADDKTAGYFILHTTADVYHSRVWRGQLVKRLRENPQAEDAALHAAEEAARALWNALDGIERRRQRRAAA